MIDPRRTGTADAPSEWLPIRPGTDAALLLGVLHTYSSPRASWTSRTSTRT